MKPIISDDPLIDFFETLRGEKVYLFPKAGNAGDGLITYATFYLLNKYEIEVEALHQGQVVSGKIVLIGGGGNLVEGRYHEVEELIEQHVEHNEVILLPHTIVGYKDILSETHRNLRVFCREHVSFEAALANGANPEKTHLSHDLTFFLDREHFKEYFKDSSGELHVLRTDGESTHAVEVPPQNIDISLSWNGDIWTSPDFCRHVTHSLAAFIAPYESVVTDRLHVSILSAFLGKKVTLLSNQYFKNQAIYEHSLKENFPKMEFKLLEPAPQAAPEPDPVTESEVAPTTCELAVSADVAEPVPAESPPNTDKLFEEVAVLSPLDSWVLDEEFIQETLARSANANVVSFDIFDTALTRLLDSPVDVFAEIERRLADCFGTVAQGFALAREDAERSARKRLFELNGAEEIGFSDIYEELPAFLPKFKEWQLAAELELFIEKGLLQAVPDILEITRKLTQQGKPYIFVSDMYLPSSFLAEALTKAGYTGWSSIHVSAEVGHTKATGKIWPKLLPEYGKKVLHIGDDEWSDELGPRKYGVETLAYIRARSERRVGAKLDPNLLPFAAAKRYFELQSRNTLNPISTEDALKNLGRSLGGIVVGNFIKWLANKVTQHKIDRLYFCARDGFLIKNAWEISGLAEKLDVKFSYLYISRAVLNLAAGVHNSTPQKLSQELLNFLSSSAGKTTVLAALDRAGLTEQKELVANAKQTFGSLNQLLLFPELTLRFEQLLQQHSTIVYECLKQRHASCLEYLRQQGMFEPGRQAMVDIGWHGTMQRSLRGLIGTAGGPDEFFGFYYGLWPAALGNRFSAGLMESCLTTEFLPNHQQLEVEQGVALLEQFHSAPHGSVKDFQIDAAGIAQPVTQENLLELRQYEEKTKYFQLGTLESIQKVFAGANDYPITEADLSRESAVSALGAVMLSPSKNELELFSGFGHCATFDHSLHEPILDSAVPDSHHLAYQKFIHSDWRVGQLRHWWLTANDHQKNVLRDIMRDHMSHLNDRIKRQFY